MIKLIVPLLLLFHVSFPTHGQQPDQVLARVRYTYIHEGDTLKNGKVRQENMLLFIGRHASIFTSYDRLIHEIAEDQKALGKAIQSAGSAMPKVIQIDQSASEWLTTAKHLHFTKEQKAFAIETILGQSYLLEETLKKIPWKISKDTATFSGLLCQKAIAEFDGKNWVAWFAPSFSFPHGPWKLQGLPGLIIEAFTEDDQIRYQFAGIENAKEGDFTRTNDVRKRAGYEPGDISAIDVRVGIDVAGAYFDNRISLSNYRLVKTSPQELEKLKAAYKKDPQGFRKAQFGF